VVGPSNQLAHSAAMAVAKAGKATFNPLFIHGACGVGKTHLLQGICNAVAGLDRPRPLVWKYLSAEQFTNEFVEALRHRNLEAFRRTYRRLDLLVIDDVHFLAAKKATQEEFLHTFNTIESAGRQVVMASDAHPRLLGQLTEQLVSRFLSGMVVKIDPPDRDTRLKILQRAAGRLNLPVQRDVLEYIALHIRGSVRELEGALVKLAAVAGVAKADPTMELARQALADHLAQTDSALTAGDIETAVAAFFGITPADIHSTRRTHTVSLARAVAMFLARRHTRMSFPEIGRFMGKNHSSVVLAVQRIEEMVQAERACRWMTPAGPKSLSAKALIDLLTEELS
jgi:chromosomal replication initiator protein